MLARRLPGILPDLLPDEALEVMRIQSAAGLLALPGGTAVLRTRPPLRAPHHTASAVAVIGGGRPLGPGEVTLAHRGVLLLDEAPEFPRSLLETLRQPLEDGVVTVARAEAVIRFPSVFQLVATRNPCPCGMLGSEDRACMCSAAEREAYQRRISGPLLDRVDLLAWVDPVRPGELLSGDAGEPSSTVKARVERARGAQLERWSASGARSALNAHAGLQDCLAAFSAAGRRELEAALAHVRGSARSVQQLARVAVSVADLEGDPRVAPGHVQEALLFCGGSRDGAGPVRLQASARQSRRAARGDEPRPHNGAEAPGT
jgi:magnesium chelatase family protein